MKDGIKLMSVHRLPMNLSNRHVAALIGLRNINVRVESVVTFSDVSNKNREQVLSLEKWLKRNHFPQLRFVEPTGSTSAVDETLLCDHLLKTWGWSDKDCDFVLRLEGIPSFNEV